MVRAAVAFLVASIVLAVVASFVDTGTWAEKSLWLAALATGSLALIAAYALGIAWARRRKRLWG